MSEDNMSLKKKADGEKWPDEATPMAVDVNINGAAAVFVSSFSLLFYQAELSRLYSFSLLLLNNCSS
jgi:hypothetical protein